jgi:hypothetical protein
MPTQREVSPVESLGASGRMRVEVASRMKVLLATGPVLKAGPIAASTDVQATAARAKMILAWDGIIANVRRWCGLLL